jgi:hypothetical protein
MDRRDLRRYRRRGADLVAPPGIASRPGPRFSWPAAQSRNIRHSDSHGRASHVTSSHAEQVAFEALLALDHSRRPPWGPLHAVAVSCYLLQRTEVQIRSDDSRLEILRAFLAGGRPSLDAKVARLRRADTRTSTGVALAVPAGFDMTILDVSVDGSFPAEGYEQRVRQWSFTTLTAWTGAEDGPY